MVGQAALYVVFDFPDSAARSLLLVLLLQELLHPMSIMCVVAVAAQSEVMRFRMFALLVLFNFLFCTLAGKLLECLWSRARLKNLPSPIECAFKGHGNLNFLPGEATSLRIPTM